MTASAPSIDYQQLFRSLPGSYLLLAADGTVLDNSDQHVAVSMLPREQAVGRNILAAYPSAPESQQALFQSQENVRRTRQPDTMPLLRYDLERPAEQGGGTEERYWELTHYPLLDAQGEVQYILQMPQDVTAQHRAALEATRAQQALFESQERMRFVLESLPVLICTSDARGQRDYLNPRWLAFTGRALDQETGEQWASSIHPDDHDRVVQTWHSSVETGSPYQQEYRLRRHDGQFRWVLMRAAPRHAADGQITMWVGGGTEIHEQKLLVEELLHANEEQAQLSEQAYQQTQLARQQRHTFHTLLTEAPAMISIVRGPEHRYEFANNRFRELVGGQDVVGKTVAEVFPELVGQGIVAMLDGVFRTGEPVIGTELRVRLAAPDGSDTLRDAYFNFVYQRFEEHGEPAGITAYSYDVTELVQARQALELLRGSNTSPSVH